MGVGHGGPADQVQGPGGMARLGKALREAVPGAFAPAGLAPVPLAAACCGLTGRGQPCVAGPWRLAHTRWCWAAPSRGAWVGRYGPMGRGQHVISADQVWPG